MALAYNIVFLLVAILMSVVLHEMAHAYVGYLLGDTTARDQGRLTLNPLKHLDLVTSFLLPVALFLLKMPLFGGAKPVPINYKKIKYNDYGVALVALAGPLCNFFLAFLAFGLMTVLNNSTIRIFLTIFYQINLGFMLFNLIPIPPLDGSRILYALLPQAGKELMMVIEQKFGLIIIMALVFFANNLLGTYVIKTSTLITNLFQMIFRL